MSSTGANGPHAAPSPPAVPSASAGRSLYLGEREFLREFARGALPALLAERLPAPAPARFDLFLENDCGQSCEFCAHPRERGGIGFQAGEVLLRLGVSGRPKALPVALDAVLKQLAARGAPSLLLLTGHDWTRHPARDALLERLAAERVVKVRPQGPHTALADPVLAARVAALPTLESIHVSLHAADPSVHDVITGAPGTGQRVLAALEHLQREGARVRLFSVLSRRATPGLGALLERVSRLGLRTTVLAVLPDRFEGGWNGAALLPRADEVRAALEAALPHRRAIETLDGFPVCAVPPELREQLRAGGPGHQRERSLHPGACGRCAARERCEGVPESYVAAHGDAGLVPE